MLAMKGRRPAIPCARIMTSANICASCFAWCITRVTVIIMNGYIQFRVMCMGGYVKARFFNGWAWVGVTKCIVGLCHIPILQRQLQWQLYYYVKHHTSSSFDLRLFAWLKRQPVRRATSLHVPKYKTPTLYIFNSLYVSWPFGTV